MDSSPNPGPHAAATDRCLRAIDRDVRTRILAGLARAFGDLDLAEDAMQEAFVQALRTWPERGVPRSPEAWLTTTAKRRALDVIRREATLARKLADLRLIQDRDRRADAQGLVGLIGVADDRLGLFFACAHPVFRPEDRIALTLRFLAGLTTSEVAHALLVPVPTMQQRLVRAKARIRALGVSFEVPAAEDLPSRLGDVQRVIYLLFSEGFSRSGGEHHVRDDLADEAIRLARVLHELMPRATEVQGLVALLLLTHARRPARTDVGGSPIALAHQDRQLWTRAYISEGIALVEEAASRPDAGAYTIQAAIAAVHAEADNFEQTDWRQIEVLYRLLASHEPSPIVRLGRAVACGRAYGARVGLRHLDVLADDPVLGRFRPFHIARAVTLRELGENDGATQAYRAALQLPGNLAEDAFLHDVIVDLQ